MSDTSKLDLRVPTREWELFIENVDERYVATDRYIRQEAESAVEEWLDMDRHARVEQIVDRFVRAGGARLRDDEEKRKSLSSDSLANAEKTRVLLHIYGPLYERLTEYSAEHSDNHLGVDFALALRAHREGGRAARIADKLERNADQIEGLLRAASDSSGGATPTETRTAAMCRELEDLPFPIGETPIPLRDIHGAIASVAPSTDGPEDVTDYLDETYRSRILDRINYEPHPENPRLFVPIEDAEQQRREQAEAEAEQQALHKNAQSARTDGGQEQDQGN